VSTEGGFRAVIAAGLANLGIAITKFVAFLFTGSLSMLSEAIHSLADTVNEASCCGAPHRPPGGLRHGSARCHRGPGGVVASRAVGRAVT
jgi:hypothetical protein